MRLIELFKEDRDVTDQELQQLETYADKLFASLGIDVEFSRHFKDRVNDPRNKKPITIAELTRLFKQIYKKHGKPIAQLGPDAEAVMKDMRTDVNVPFALQWDGKELDLVAKTIMRKPNFATPNPEFAVEGKRIPRKKGQPAGSKKHSDLYTDENPKGTIHGLKFATVKDAEASVSKIRGSGKKHAHKIQAAVAMEQRAKAAGKTSAAAVYRKFINSMKKKTKAMKESLVEAYMMDLNQDEDMLVLKVIDTDKPGHVEIRGKKNYETDGYDPKDPLHKVLDQLDPATVAKLYGNEEPVFLNPKNPRTEKTIAKAMQLMKEHGLVPMYHTMKAYKMTRAKHPDGSAYFKSDYPKYESLHEGRDADLYHVTDDAGVMGILRSGAIKPKNIYTDREAGEEAEIGPRISLTRDFDFDLGDFKLIIDQSKLAQTHRIKPYTPEEMRDEVEDEEEEYVQKSIPLGYIKAIHLESDDDATDELKDLAKRAGIPLVTGDRRNLEVVENFADGKVKGKSRPGRVKRAGASCKGSVTDLRRKAKNSSGEKAKKYHWCANMKSGKKK